MTAAHQAADVQGHPRLHHRLDGAGPRLVLLHPVGLDLTCFDTLVADLGGRFTVLRVDLPGHGKSPPPAAAPTLADYAEDVHALLRWLNFAPAAVAGFSFGGMVAQVLALDHPEDVSAVVISACAATLPEESRRILADRGAIAERDGMPAVVDATLARWFSTAFRERGDDRPVRDQLVRVDPQHWAEAWRAMAAVDTMPRLHAITVPTLCLAGAADVSAPPNTLRAIADRINGARLEVVADAPHMLFIEHPRTVANVLTSFLESCPVQESRTQFS
jgi:3-oxoadipate enol-lactonase